MLAKQIVPGLYGISLGPVNVFLIDHEADLTLIDTGIPASTEKILRAIQELGKRPAQLKHIVVTHCHPDHAGSLAALKQATGALAYMHPRDAELVVNGQASRPLGPAPGLVNHIIFKLFVRAGTAHIPAARVECLVNDGEELPVAGGIKAIHAPGHCAGQLALLWPQHGGVLFAADTASNMLGLNLSMCYEDLAEGQRTLARLAGLEFEVACFGHGKAITSGAAQRFRQKFT